MSAAHTEALLISAVVSTGEVGLALDRGVDKSWFVQWTEVWIWVEDYWRTHRVAPSGTLLRHHWSSFPMEATDEVEHLIEELRREHQVREVTTMLREGVSMLTDGTSPEKVAERLSTGMREVVRQISRGKVIDVIEDWEESYREALLRHERQQNEGLAGIPTGLERLDEGTGGIADGHYWLVAARPGAGKTWTLVKAAAENVVHGRRVLFVSLEQSRREVAMRTHALLARGKVKVLELMAGGGDIIAYKRWLEELRESVDGRLHVVDEARMSVARIGAIIENVRPSLVLVDYLGLLEKSSNDWVGYGEVSEELRHLSRGTELPFLVAAQANRAGIIGQHQQPPKLEHLAGSDQLGRDADAVVTMSRQTEHLLKMRLAKYRHGQDGYTWHVAFNPATGVFECVSGDRADYIRMQDEETEE